MKCTRQRGGRMGDWEPISESLKLRTLTIGPQGSVHSFTEGPIRIKIAYMVTLAGIKFQGLLVLILLGIS